MKTFTRVFGAAALVGLTTPAWAARVALVSSEVPAKVTSEEKTKEPALAESRSPKDLQNEEKRERLLKELRELYKQGQPES